MDLIEKLEMPSSLAASEHNGRSSNYAEKPLLVYWEATLACPLACNHCRAEAMPSPHPLQLDRREAADMLRQVAGFGNPSPHLVITGGDPLQRPDLFELIALARSLDLRVSITPSATIDLDRGTIRQLKGSGIQSMALSLDGSTPQRHDALRGVPGCYEWTVQAARVATQEGIPLQMNTLVAAETLEDLPAIYRVVRSVEVVRWSLFFLIPVGRGRMLREITPHQSEDLMHRLYDLAQEASFVVATTEAPHYRRVALTRMRTEGQAQDHIRRSPVRQGFGIRDGNGVVFISHRGDIFPAGFLPLAAGNVRKDSLPRIYRQSSLFRSLRDPAQFKGKCGRCPFKGICGGSRARAFAHTGDPLESDPLCLYEPERGAAGERS
ncbi:MAG: TIGR04053 family radical SAM/SPASM domain-containing protein [Anaerolineae bacterium]